MQCVIVQVGKSLELIQKNVYIFFAVYVVLRWMVNISNVKPTKSVTTSNYNALPDSCMVFISLFSYYIERYTDCPLRSNN